MTFDEFVSRVKAPAQEWQCGEPPGQGDVVLFGTLLAATPESCCIEVHGRQCEIAASDVIDIQVIRPPEPVRAGKEVEPPPAAADSAIQCPLVVLMTVQRDTLVCHRFRAALLAALGTWMWVLPGAPAPVAAGAQG
jgi:hypothetical protein